MYGRKSTYYRKRKRSSTAARYNLKSTRNKKRRRNKIINMGVRNFPSTCIMNFTFCNQYNINSSTLSYAQGSFLANSIYDCLGDNSNLTATPYLAAFNIYNRVSVISSTFVATCSNNTTVPLEVYLAPYDFANIGVLDPIQWAENIFVKKSIMDAPTRGGKSTTTIRSRMSTSKLLNLNPKDERLSSEVGTKPYAQWFWVIGFRCLGTGFANAYINVKITYRAQLSSRLIVQN